MRIKFLQFCKRLRGGADPDDDVSDDDMYNERPIVVPKHKRGREIKSSILSRKAVEAVRQMSLSTKHYDPLNVQAGHASVVEEYHRGYSNDQMYLVPDSTLRTMKNIVNYQFKKPQPAYYVGGPNPDSVPQPTIFDNIKMSLDSVMLKIEGLEDDSSDLTTTSGTSNTSDSPAIETPNFYNEEEEEGSKLSQQIGEQNINVKPPEYALVKQIGESEMPESHTQENHDSSDTSPESETEEAPKELDNDQVLKDPSNLIQQTEPVTDTNHPNADTSYAEGGSDHPVADTAHPQPDTRQPAVDRGHLKSDEDHIKSYTVWAESSNDNYKSGSDGLKSVIADPKHFADYFKADQARAKKLHHKQYFLIEGKFEPNLKPVFAIKKCKLTNEVLTNSAVDGRNHKQIIFAKRHSKKIYLDIEGQFAHKKTSDKGNEYIQNEISKDDDTDSMNECEFSINAQRVCRDNSEIKINITGHLIRQENSLSFVPVLVIKLRNKSSKVNTENPQIYRKQDTADMPLSSEDLSQVQEQSNTVNKQMSPRDETIQGLPSNYQTMPLLINEGVSNVYDPLLHQTPQMFQSGPLINYQALPLLISGPDNHVNKQQINQRKEIGQGIINNQIVPILTTNERSSKRDRTTYRAVNSQVMPVFQMPVFQIPVIESLHFPQNQYYTVIPLQQSIRNVGQYLTSQITDHTNSILVPGNAFSSVVQDNNIVAPDLNLYSPRVPKQNSSVNETNPLPFSNLETSEINNVDQIKPEKITALEPNGNKSITHYTKFMKSKKKNKNESSEKARPMDTGGGGNKINIVNNPIVGQLEEFFIGHVHVPQTYPHGDTFELSNLKKKFSPGDIVKIKKTAGYILCSDLQQISESYPGETMFFEKSILKIQRDIENFFVKTEKVEALILLPTFINNCKIYYTEINLRIYFEESFIKTTLQHTIVVVFCNGNLWFIAEENSNNSNLHSRKVTLLQYFRHFGINKSTIKVRCATQKDLSKRKFSDKDLKKLVEKLTVCCTNTAEISGHRKVLSVTSSGIQLPNKRTAQNEILNICWDVINFLK